MYRYQIENEIGAGGMATLFRARDIKHNRHIAINLWHPQPSALLGAERFPLCSGSRAACQLRCIARRQATPDVEAMERSPLIYVQNWGKEVEMQLRPKTPRQ